MTDEAKFFITLPDGTVYEGNAAFYEIEQSIPPRESIEPYFKIELSGWGEISADKSACRSAKTVPDMCEVAG